MQLKDSGKIGYSAMVSPVENRAVKAYGQTAASQNRQDSAKLHQTLPDAGRSGAEESQGVTLDVSEQAREMQRRLQEFYRQQAQDADKEADAITEVAKIMEIARRISNGDHVPATDEKKLMEHSFELYQIAKSAAMLNQDKEHKEYDALFEEDEENPNGKKLRDLRRESCSGIAPAKPEAGPEAAESVPLE